MSMGSQRARTYPAYPSNYSQLASDALKMVAGPDQFNALYAIRLGQPSITIGAHVPPGSAGVAIARAKNDPAHAQLAMYMDFAKSCILNMSPNWLQAVKEYNAGATLSQPWFRPWFNSFNNYFKQGQALPGRMSAELGREAVLQWAHDALPGGFEKFMNVVVKITAVALTAYVTAGMASELSAASTSASSGAATAAAPSSTSISTGLSSTSTVTSGGADLTATGMGGSASLNTGLSNIVSTSLSGGDIVTASANLATGGSLTAGSSLAAGGLGGALGTAAVPLGMTAQGVSDLSLLSPTGTSLAQPLAVSDYVQQAAQTLNQGLTTAQAGMKAIATAKAVQSALSGPKPLGPQPLASQAAPAGVASPAIAKSSLNAILLAVAGYLIFF